jgi:hypothetical protein
VEHRFHTSKLPNAAFRQIRQIARNRFREVPSPVSSNSSNCPPTGSAKPLRHSRQIRQIACRQVPRGPFASLAKFAKLPANRFREAPSPFSPNSPNCLPTGSARSGL